VPDLLDAGVTLMAGWVLTYLVHSTVLIGAVWVATELNWVRAPEARDFLWKFALVAGVVSATGARMSTRFTNDTAQFDMMTRVEAVAVDHTSSDMLPNRVVESGSQAVVRGPLKWNDGWGIASDLGDISAEPGMIEFAAVAGELSAACRTALRDGGVGPLSMESVRTACTGGPALSWYHGLLLLWAAGAGGLLVGLARDEREVRILRDGLVRAGRRPQRLLAQVTRDTGLSPRLTTSVEVDAPCVVDAQTVVLPVRCASELTDDELRAVLAHEVAHVARRDVAWLRFARMFSALFWLQPLNRLAVSGMVESAELVCDDWALARTRQPLGLARSISRVAEWAIVPHRRPEAVVAMAGGDGRSLSNRVRRILTNGANPAGSARWRRWAGAAVLLVPVLLLPVVPGPPSLHVEVFVAEGNIALQEIGGSELPLGFAQRQQIRLRLSEEVAAGRVDGPSNAVFVTRELRRVDGSAPGS
jgi:bla regulator protein blaR1